MERGKRGRVVVLILLAVLLIISFVKPISALGLAPAKTVLNFRPGGEHIFTYRVLGISPTKELQLSVSGELAEYAKLDRDTLTGPGEFSVILKLPTVLEKPGPNILFVEVAEKVDDEIASTVGTSVTVNGLIVVNVPFPGKYLDVFLITPDSNVGDSVRFDLRILSKGDQDVFAKPRIEVSSQEGIIETLFFNEREVLSQAEVKLKKSLDTTSYNPGRYSAKAIVDYTGDEPAIAESIFRIGELRIDILNYTKQVLIHKTAKFEIEIESGWNNEIETISADVGIFNGTGKIAQIETTSTELVPWEKKVLVGYFDSSEIVEGFYDANITLSYHGKDVGKSSSELVRIEFVKEGIDSSLILYIVGGIIALGIIIFLIIKVVFNKNAKRK